MWRSSWRRGGVEPRWCWLRFRREGGVEHQPSLYPPTFSFIPFAPSPRTPFAYFSRQQYPMRIAPRPRTKAPTIALQDSLATSSPVERALLNRPQAQRLPVLPPDPQVVCRVELAEYRDTLPREDARVDLARRRDDGHLATEGWDPRCQSGRDARERIEGISKARRQNRKRKGSNSPTLDREPNVVDQSRPSDDEDVLADLLHPVLRPRRNDTLNHRNVQRKLARLESDVERRTLLDGRALPRRSFGPGDGGGLGGGVGSGAGGGCKEGVGCGEGGGTFGFGGEGGLDGERGREEVTNAVAHRVCLSKGHELDGAKVREGGRTHGDVAADVDNVLDVLGPKLDLRDDLLLKLDDTRSEERLREAESEG